MPTYHIQTYGCQMNYSDTERVETYLEALGYKKSEALEKADLALFNTCSIRQKAEDRVLGQMKNMAEFRKKNPNLRVAITGCMVRKSSSRYSEDRDPLFNQIRELDLALRIAELPKLATLLREIEPESKVEGIPEESLEDYFMIKPNYTSNAQAFVPVSTGCDKFCTYCIVPYSRGREHSRKMQEILDECEKLVENGCLEITLIGQTVNSYGRSMSDKLNKKFEYLKDEKGKLHEPFAYLLHELDKLHEKGLRRVRFTSPHPRDMTDQLIDAMTSLRTQMPFLHLPVQSGDDRTLKRMNRTYTTEEYRKIIQKLRKKNSDISITTDIIVGFSDETEEEFENTYRFFEEMGFEHAYIAQYSERKGTFASKHLKDNISPKVKKKRWDRLNDFLRKQSSKALGRFKGKTVGVLVETQEKGECTGRSEHFKTVQFKSEKNLVGKIMPVKITEALEWSLKGELEI